MLFFCWTLHIPVHENKSAHTTSNINILMNFNLQNNIITAGANDGKLRENLLPPSLFMDKRRRVLVLTAFEDIFFNDERFPWLSRNGENWKCANAWYDYWVTLWIEFWSLSKDVIHFVIFHRLNSLAPGRCGRYIRLVIFKRISRKQIFSMSREIVLK